MCAMVMPTVASSPGAPLPPQVARLLRRHERAQQRYGPQQRAAAQKQRAERAAAGHWEIAEVEPGLFQVVNLDDGHHTYHVAYLPDAPDCACWVCDCPDYSAGGAAVYGVLCKHVLAVHRSGYAVAVVEDGERMLNGEEAPARIVPCSLFGAQAGEPAEAPQTSGEEETMDTPSLRQVMESLSTPFPVEAVSWKPQIVRKDGTAALAVPYADLRTYEDRLNEVAPADWSSHAEFTVAGDRLVCTVHLTICGVARAGDGEAVLKDRNPATSAYAQAMKRACSRFGLGRYLYDLPTSWVAYDQQGKRFTSKGLKKLEADYLRVTGQKAKAAPRANGNGGGKATPRKPTGGNDEGNGEAGADQVQQITRMLTTLGFSTKKAQAGALAKAGFEPLAELTAEQAQAAIDRLETALLTQAQA